MAIAAAVAVVGGAVVSSSAKKSAAKKGAAAQLSAEDQKRELYDARGIEAGQAYQPYIGQGVQSDQQLNELYGVAQNIQMPERDQTDYVGDATAKFDQYNASNRAAAMNKWKYGEATGSLLDQKLAEEARFDEMAGVTREQTIADAQLTQDRINSQYESTLADAQRQQGEANDRAALVTPESRLADMYSNYQESPGVQWQREQGMRGLEGQASAAGVGGGSRLKAISRFNQGLAMQDFGNYFNRQQQFDAQRREQLQRNSGVGFQAMNNNQQIQSNLTTGTATSLQNTGQINAGREMAIGAANAQIGNSIAQVGAAYAGGMGGAGTAQAPAQNSMFAPAQGNRFSNQNMRTA